MQTSGVDGRDSKRLDVDGEGGCADGFAECDFPLGCCELHAAPNARARRFQRPGVFLDSEAPKWTGT